MKKTKKLLAMLMAFAMILAMAVPAFASTENNLPVSAEKTYTLTINGKHEDHIYEAYQIFAGTLDSSGKILSNIKWGENIDGAAFIAYLSTESTGVFKEGETVNIFAGLTTAQEIADKLKGYSDNDSMLDVFAKAAGNYLKSDPTPETSTGNGITYTIDDLAAGYYLIKDKDTESVDPENHDFYTKFMLKVVADTNVTVKGNVPSVGKTVNDQLGGTYDEREDVQIGETVYYKWEATMPSNYKMYETYFFRFVDTLSKGLTFNKIEKVYILQEDNDEIELPASLYTLEGPVAAEDDGTMIKLTIHNLKDANMPAQLALEDKIVVKYSATLNENAEIGVPGNPNTVYLEYSNNPYDEDGGDYGTTPEDEALVFTFAMDVTKVDKETGNRLSDAQFVLYTRDFVDNTQVVYKYVLFNKTADGAYKAVGSYSSNAYVADSTTPIKVWEDTIEKAKAESVPLNLEVNGTVSSTADGKFFIEGLDARTYRLLEVKAPDGYNLPHDPFVVIYEPEYDKDGKLIGFNYEVDTQDKVGTLEGVVELTVENNKGTTLPSTGGVGTTMFYLIGGIMVAGAVVLLVTKKRMSVQE